MRIALYSRLFAPSVGGLERFGEDLAEWLSARGHTVTVLTLTTTDRDNVRPYFVIRSTTPETVRKAFRSADAVLVNGLSVRGIAVAMAAGRRPIVVHQNQRAVCPAGLAWSPSGPCNVDERHIGPCAFCPRKGITARLNVRVQRAAMQTAYTNVVISDYMRSLIRAPRSVTIYNPVHRRAFQTYESPRVDGSRIAFAGRLVDIKGLDSLLKALVDVPGVRLDVVGDGPLLEAWKRLSRDLGLHERVNFMGQLPFDALARVYGQAAAVCIPSVWQEPFGYAVAEAMALGRPVIAFRHGAFTELLENGRGFLCPQSTTSSLAATIKLALGDTDRLQRTGHAARRFAEENLHMDRLGPRYEEMLKTAAA
jgi:glycosyltransferase involved in cell wall biosynthesis